MVTKIILLERVLMVIGCLLLFIVVPYYMYKNAEEYHWYEEQGMITTKGICTKTTIPGSGRFWIYYEFELNDSIYKGNHDVIDFGKHRHIEAGDSILIKYSKIDYSYHYLK